MKPKHEGYTPGPWPVSYTIGLERHRGALLAEENERLRALLADVLKLNRAGESMHARIRAALSRP